VEIESTSVEVYRKEPEKFWTIEPSNYQTSAIGVGGLV